MAGSGMIMRLALSDAGPAISPISPRRELGAYEALWLEKGATFKTLAERFANDPSALPSDFVSAQLADQCAADVLARLKKAGVHQFGVRIHHAGDYPPKLRDAKHPVELLYYRGAWELSETRCMAVVGSREPSEDGIKRAARLARELVERDFTVVSGLARGIDVAAHSAAIARGGRTIAVVGTPLGTCYPKEHLELQETIARDHLLISQVPVLRYSKQAPQHNRLFFPERNATMSALTEGTIIVEAGETSGTLTQARAALHQGRKLFILDSCFNRTDISWPARFEAEGAIRVRTPEDIWNALGQPPSIPDR
ncbi:MULTISPECIES: DNA-processing protein DprA [Alphaproteobacteria]|jgi:DNA processing protein|uniref:DNA-processing protein DprA n=1 Tax=Sphingopyxis sp. TaxID=1908224 RepID=UPI004034964C